MSGRSWPADGLVRFEAAAMYVCAASYRRTARDRLQASLVEIGAEVIDRESEGLAGTESEKPDGALIVEFAQPAPARRLRELLAGAAGGAVWVESGGYGVRRRLRRHRLLTTPDRQARLLAGLREAWQAGVEAVGGTRNTQRAAARATELWRGFLAAGYPVRTARGLCLPLPAGPLAKAAVDGARQLGISARVRHTAQFSVVTVDNQIEVLRLVRLMPSRQGGREHADG